MCSFSSTNRRSSSSISSRSTSTSTSRAEPEAGAAAAFAHPAAPTAKAAASSSSSLWKLETQEPQADTSTISSAKSSICRTCRSSSSSCRSESTSNDRAPEATLQRSTGTSATAPGKSLQWWERSDKTRAKEQPSTAPSHSHASLACNHDHTRHWPTSWCISLLHATPTSTAEHCSRVGSPA